MPLREWPLAGRQSPPGALQPLPPRRGWELVDNCPGCLILSGDSWEVGSTQLLGRAQRRPALVASSSNWSLAHPLLALLPAQFHVLFLACTFWGRPPNNCQCPGLSASGGGGPSWDTWFLLCASHLMNTQPPESLASLTTLPLRPAPLIAGMSTLTWPLSAACTHPSLGSQRALSNVHAFPCQSLSSQFQKSSSFSNNTNLNSSEEYTKWSIHLFSEELLSAPLVPGTLLDAGDERGKHGPPFMELRAAGDRSSASWNYAVQQGSHQPHVIIETEIN